MAARPSCYLGLQSTSTDNLVFSIENETDELFSVKNHTELYKEYGLYNVSLIDSDSDGVSESISWTVAET